MQVIKANASDRLLGKIRIVNHERVSTIILTTVLQLQVFRRLSLAGYMGIMLLAYLYWFGSIRISRKISIRPCGLIFVLSYIALPVISFFNTSTQEFFAAIIRFGALFPFLLIGMLYPRIIYDYLEDIVKVFTYVVIASAILMIYQVPFGRISFFVEANSRIGYERYGSLLGSTTTYGTSSIVALYYLVDFDILRGWKKIVSEVLIIIGGILCLSKSFFVNIALGVGLIVLFHKKDAFEYNLSLNKVLKAALTLAFAAAVLYWVLQNTFVGKYFWRMLKYSFNSNSLGVQTSLANRLTVKPEAAFQYYRIPYYFYILGGVGFKGYSGVLGLPQYPMCHNNYFDMLLAQGAVSLVSYLGIHISAFITQLNRRDAKAVCIKKMVPYKLINMLAGLGSYLTVGGGVNFLVVYSVYSHRNVADEE